jgi:ribosomal protein L3 glutamine methyltransferase
MSEPSAPITELHTVRDWLRYGVSRFNEAKLVFGHGSATAQDEAAYLILKTLHLAIDQLEPWLDARLTKVERSAIAAIIEKRVITRKPAAYLTHEAWIGGCSFYVDERVVVPRSYIGELLGGGLAGVVTNPARVRRILDLCTGSGCLAIVAALEFSNATVDASDISGDALAVAAHNVADYQLQDRISLVKSDLFAAFGNRRYDLILANPPYVTSAALAAFPPEYKAEPTIAHDGGQDGLDFVRRILAAAPTHLTSNGHLIVETGTAHAQLEREYPDLPFLWLDTQESANEVFALAVSAFARKRKPRSCGPRI